MQKQRLHFYGPLSIDERRETMRWAKWYDRIFIKNNIIKNKKSPGVQLVLSLKVCSFQKQQSAETFTRLQWNKTR